MKWIKKDEDENDDDDDDDERHWVRLTIDRQQIRLIWLTIWITNYHDYWINDETEKKKNETLLLSSSCIITSIKDKPDFHIDTEQNDHNLTSILTGKLFQ